MGDFIVSVHQFIHDGKRYELEIPLERIDPTETGCSVLTIARVQRLDNGETLASIQVKIDVNFETRQLQIFHHDQLIGTLHLDMGLDVANAVDKPDMAINWLALAQDFSSGTPVEDIIDSIPTDPLLGCFIKGGVSATLGQIIECWAKIRPKMPDARAIDLGRAMAECLGHNALRTLGRAAWRIGRCMIRLGL